MLPIILSAACITSTMIQSTEPEPHVIKALELSYDDKFIQARLELYQSYLVLNDKYENVPFEKVILPVLAFMYISFVEGNTAAFISSVECMDNLLYSQKYKHTKDSIDYPIFLSP